MILTNLFEIVTMFTSETKWHTNDQRHQSQAYETLFVLYANSSTGQTYSAAY